MVDATLIAALEQKKTALALRCIDAMYEDPFWLERFGERGRKHAEEDAAFHVKYLCAALREEDAAIFRHYAVWLRGVLASRGMCSWHLVESFRNLTLALGAEGVTPAGPVAALLANGSAALTYRDGAAGELAQHAARLLESKPGADYRNAELVSFLLDGVARGDIRAFPAHVTFLRERLATDTRTRSALATTLAELRERCRGLPCTDAAAKAVQLLDAAALPS